ncbi:DUF5694 domain-containing protein [Sphingosinicella sp. CPCC 101087]|uniref:DUF5694 domain-containing protein n=1 Tax=Sphingosinicella sp. CPCC 101087 TaxID=2497754 RepID=UPI00101CAA2C|nr:DUF5694 domain-containing protein [Sphingosinicella sp. CPCC 101087]
MREVLIGTAACLAVIAAPAVAKEAAPAEVMILGTYHMGNPGRDLANMEADDVTRPRRQAEMEALAEALAGWRPTKILVEWERPAPFTVERYRAFGPEDLLTDRNEVVQIGFRLARRLGHGEVYGFDEQGGDGEPDYFPFDRVQGWAAAHGRSAVVDETLSFFRAMVAEEGRALADHSIAEMLLIHNDPARDRMGHARGYYAFLPLGDAEDQVGAELNSYWYMRNAKMFAKAALIAEPGDRLLVLVGSGHRYWLTHFAETTPGFTSVDPRPWLQRAVAEERETAVE